jgi:voltage-dependent potassium channel beta subunit
MLYRHLGKSGLVVSVLGLGNWVTATKIEEAEAYEIYVQAFRAGINLFDTAEIYDEGEAERRLGRIIRRGEEQRIWKRSDLVLSTKIIKGGNGPNDVGLSRKHVIEGAKASLQRLGLEYVDLIFAHRPDRATPMEETVRAFTHLIDRGFALYWGTSEWSAAELAEAYAIARQFGLIAPTMEQPHYNMFTRHKVEVEFFDLYKRDSLGLGIISYSPLAFGILTGKYNGGVPDGSRLQSDEFKETREFLETQEGRVQLAQTWALAQLAAELDCTSAQLAIAWVVDCTHVTSTLLGVRSLKQLTENLGALSVLPRLTPLIKHRVEAILGNKPALKIYFNRV